jgi:N-acetylmuramoyl-L-alanine amidase
MRMAAMYGALMLLAMTAATVLAEPPMAFSDPSPRIVLDPGHGGRDTGARGPTGLMEKAVSMELARKLALRLEPDFQVFLTRSDDYQVDLPQRAALANQSNAILMISIHTGSGFLHRTEGIGVFFYAPLKGDGGPTTNSGDAVADKRWRKAQLRHKKASMNLAKSLHVALTGPAGGDRDIRGAPLKVLEGADLPAVLVEVGHITHPATEMNLSTDEGIDRLSQALADGIRRYIQKADDSGRSSP